MWTQLLLLTGNIIIRAALTEPCLKPYLGRMWLFVSLSGPHLGYLCAPNKLFCSGMWLFKKFTAGRHQPFCCTCSEIVPAKFGQSYPWACNGCEAIHAVVEKHCTDMTRRCWSCCRSTAHASEDATPCTPMHTSVLHSHLAN